MMFWGIWLNLLLANFNIIPIPPLDGSHVFYHLLPPELGARYRTLSQYGFLILIGLLFLAPGVIYTLLLPSILVLRWTLEFLSPFMLQPFRLF